MKKYLFLSLVLTSFVYGIHYATFLSNISNKHYRSHLIDRQDTVKNLQDNIVNIKSKFKNQPLNVLLKKLNLNVKSYLPHYQLKPLGDLVSITLFFEESKTVSHKLQHQQDVPILTVTFVDKITRRQVANMAFESAGNWRDVEKEFYGTMIVKDIQGLQGTHNKK